MNELLIVFLILLISFLMFAAIILILKADRKVLELNVQVTKFKETDFSQLKRIVKFFSVINDNIKLGKIKYYFEIAMTVISAINIIIVAKKIMSFFNKNKKYNKR